MLATCARSFLFACRNRAVPQRRKFLASGRKRVQKLNAAQAAVVTKKTP